MKNKKEYDREWYHKNKERIQQRKNETQKNRRDRGRNFIVNYLKSHPCVDCGEDDFVVLEFDHKGDKERNISDMVQNRVEKIEEEIQKCEVVCANCHRRRTSKQLGWYKNIEGEL